MKNKKTNIGFLTEAELKAITEKHSIVFFGAGIYAEKTMNLMNFPPLLMVDNNLKKQGTAMEGIPIESPKVLTQFLIRNPKAVLIICVQKYSEVIEQLSQMNLLDTKRVFITPIAHELSVIEDIREHDATLMLSNYDNAGGLYLYQIQSGELKKLASGSIRGFVQVENRLYYVSYTGLNCIDAYSYEPIKHLELEAYDFCGLIYDESQGHLIIGETQYDRILFVDEKSLKIEKSISFTDKCSHFGKEYHHVNDLVNIGNFILASVFSVHGWWRYGLYDGGVIEINKQTHEMRQIPIKECWFPHSLKLHEGRLYILDSMNGTLLRDMRDNIFGVDGFLRGLEFNGDYCYIGQSLHRHVSRLNDRRTVSADCGIHVFNTQTRLRRFISLPELTNIYQIAVVDPDQLQ